MALSQVALNVFYLFNGRKILCRPKRKAHTRALQLHGDVPSVGMWMHPHMSIHLQPCSIWHLGVLLHGNECAEAGVCCRVWMSVLSGMSSPQILAACSTTVTVSTGRAELSHWTLWRGLYWVNPSRMKPGLGFHEEGAQWTWYCRGYCHLLFMFVLFSASLCYYIIKYIFHVK